MLNARASERGISLPIILLVLLLTATSATIILTRTSQDLRHAVMLRKIKTATNLANNVTTDVMRQFSQSYQADHYSEDALDRNPTQYGQGYSILSSSAHPSQHFVSFEAQGGYGADVDSPQHTKKVTGVVKFISDLTTFGTMSNGPFTTSASNVVYAGKVWINGNWTISGTNNSVSGGPVFVNGNIAETGAGTFTINGDLYRSGTRSGSIVVTGTDYTWVPTMTWPTIDNSYFDTYSNVKVTANTAIVFSSSATGGRVRVGTTTYNIPSDGFIIYGRNCVLTASGTVQGRVTIASIRASGAAGGTITMNGNLIYATPGSSTTANVNDSFAAISSHGIDFNKTGSDLYVCGVYWVDNAAVATITSNGTAGRTLYVIGTRNRLINLPEFTLSARFDTNLDTYPPPGLPERPNLVSWHIK